MRQIPLEELRAGAPLEEALFHRSGTVVLPAGATLTAEHVEALRSCDIKELFTPDAPEDVAPFLLECRYEKIDFKKLRRMPAAPHDLYDTSEALIASQGQKLTQDTLQLLEKSVSTGLHRRKTPVERKLGQAETFLRKFPVERPPAETDTSVMRREESRPAGEAVQVPQLTPGRAPRVLVAEDEENIRAIIAKFLRQSGFAVFEAPNGKEALVVADRDPVDVALLDVMMPGMDGIRVCRNLKSAQNPPIVIMVTAKSSKADIFSALQAGADDYVVKPFSRAVLISKILRHIQARR